jgi:AraC family transcriptional regulator
MNDYTMQCVLRAMRFIEENLKTAITVGDAADAAGYSLYHFIRTFNAATGHSPYDYVMRRRLTESAKDLVTFPQRRILDIALDYTFNSHETYSRAFLKMFGMPPKEFRSPDMAIRILRELVYFEPMDLEYLEFISSCDLVPETIQRDVTHIQGLGTPIGGMWDAGRLHLQEAAEERLNGHNGSENDPRTRFGVISLHKPLYYFFGYRLDGQGQNANPPPDLSRKTIPAGDYIEFHHTGGPGTLRHMYRYLFQTWIPEYGMRKLPDFLLEEYRDDSVGIFWMRRFRPSQLTVGVGTQ